MATYLKYADIYRNRGAQPTRSLEPQRVRLRVNQAKVADGGSPMMQRNRDGSPSYA